MIIQLNIILNFNTYFKHGKRKGIILHNFESLSLSLASLFPKMKQALKIISIESFYESKLNNI